MSLTGDHEPPEMKNESAEHDAGDFIYLFYHCVPFPG